jgi:hypothetical protein
MPALVGPSAAGFFLGKHSIIRLLSLLTEILRNGTWQGEPRLLFSEANKIIHFGAL